MSSSKHEDKKEKTKEKDVTVDGGSERHCASFLLSFIFFLWFFLRIPGSESSQALSTCHFGEGCLERR
jgi:hypothetical protein